MSKSPKARRGAARASRRVHELHLRLREGFRGQTVVITVDGREVFRAEDVTSDGSSGRGALHVVTAARMARVHVHVTPGGVEGSLEVDVASFPCVAISLIGDGTVSFETSPASPAIIESRAARCGDHERRASEDA